MCSSSAPQHCTPGTGMTATPARARRRLAESVISAPSTDWAQPSNSATRRVACTGGRGAASARAANAASAGAADRESNAPTGPPSRPAAPRSNRPMAAAGRSSEGVVRTRASAERSRRCVSGRALLFSMYSRAPSMMA
ncbi:hypothetical protein G6F68_018956 [Rhizopus microsporus]|nr:hypothetical protein G6F68_018956 [Rhizopus microsporus]